MLLSLLSTWTSTEIPEGDRFGKTIHILGDIDGDGDLELAATADSPDGVTSRTMMLTEDGEEEIVVESLLGNQSSPVTPGDLNGDGYDDIVLRNGFIDTAVILTGSAEGFVEAATIVHESEGNFGSSAGAVGDMDGDGYPDFVLGDPDDTTHGFESGAAFLVHGGPELPTELVALYPEEPTEKALFGSNTAPVGDVDGDGLDDFHIGAVRYSEWDGAAYIFTASATHLLTVEESGGHFGGWAHGGDIDGDGYSDVAIIAYEYEFRGATYIYAGGPSRLTPAYILSPQDAYIYGRGVVLDDIDLDGHADYLVGVVDDDLASTVHLQYGGPSGLDDAVVHDFGSTGGLSMDFMALDADGFLLVVGSGLDENVRFLEGCADPDADGECGPVGQAVDTAEPEEEEDPEDGREPYDPGGCGCGAGGLPATLLLLPVLLVRRADRCCC